jgi:hypothetical protein
MYTSATGTCLGTAGRPALGKAANHQPWLGEAFELRVTAIPSGTSVFLITGQSRTTWSGFTLPLALTSAGLTGCWLYAGVDVLGPQLATTGGVASLLLALPLNRSLIGRSLFQQALVIDPGGNTAGATTSNAMELRFGLR